MKWFTVFSLALGSAVFSAGGAALPAKPESTATLRWNNGESIPGEIVAGSKSELTWKSPVFDQPISLHWSSLRRVDRSLSAVTSEEPFLVRLRDGSVVLGDLVAITEDTISLRTGRHGNVVLRRAEVLSVRRTRGSNLLFSGPIADCGWRISPDLENQPASRATSSQGPTVPKAQEGPGGTLELPYWNSDARLDFAIPERVDAEVRLTSTARIDVLISFEADPKQRLRVETWDDDLVLTAANQFQRIRKITDQDRTLALRICWDRPAHRCAVYSLEGDLIVNWQVPDEPDAPKSDTTVKRQVTTTLAIRRATEKKSTWSKPGILLQGKGRQLTLEQFIVRSWDGQPPTKLDPNRPRVELADGQRLVRKVTTAADAVLHLEPLASGEELSLPMDEVHAIVFASEAPGPKERDLKLTFNDGTMISGSPVSISDGRVTLDTSFTEQPLGIPIDGLRQMLVRVTPPAGSPPEQPLTNMDKLTVGQTTLHGTMSGSGRAFPEWKLAGSDVPVTPVKGGAAEITRAFPSGKVIQSAPALFYLDAGDVLPGRLRGVDRNGVELESDVVELKRIPAANLDAIQFGAATRAKFSGFLDPGWQVVKGNEETVRRTNDSLQMEPGTVISHPSALFASEVKFTMKSKSFSCVRLRLFSEDADGSKSPNLVIMHMGSRVTAGLDSGDGQFEEQNQVNVPTGRPTRIKLVISEKHVTLSVGGYQLQKFAIDRTKRPGAGLIIEPSSMWGNSVNPIELSEFSANSEIGKTWLPDVPADAKLRAVTVPRFRKDDAPRHALLAGNGDVLRGEIESMTANHFGFRSGLENLRIPRDRVKAAIWLKKAEDGVSAPSTPAESVVIERLSRQMTTRISYGGASLSTLIGVLKRQDADLKFKIVPNDESRTFDMSFGSQTLGDALEQICSLFDVGYRIDQDGTIIVEAGKSAQPEMIQKTYWLKTDAFKTGTAREALVAKGVPFPAGTNAKWKASSRQLTIINTPENHQKLGPVLEADFGGTAGSPSHWLSLANGARLGLVIDRFDPDAVVGHHPVYGACRVPLDDIFMVRTSVPQTSEAMKAVGDWRLVFAPEPVLPETPGESSPLLGKVAKPFKLSLLGGGDFDLAKEQGKVVILDFWATWCGPCIKSLPGLLDAVGKLPADRVKLIGVNQGEPPEQVKRFIETRQWALTVALDSSQSVARDYGVDGIPFTVIVGPDGKVAWVNTGYRPEAEVELVKAVEQLLGTTPP